MSQKMTDEELGARYLALRDDANGLVLMLATEAKRARSEEARLLEENRKQAEQIKALADALEAIAKEPTSHKAWCDAQAALNLAGRL